MGCTHPRIIVVGILQENLFFDPPDQFLKETRERRDNSEKSLGLIGSAPANEYRGGADR